MFSRDAEVRRSGALRTQKSADHASVVKKL